MRETLVVNEFPAVEHKKAIDLIINSLPDEKVPIVEWLEDNISLSKASAHEDGPYKIDRTPYLREIYECFADDITKEIAIVTGTQMGKTTLLMNCAFYSLSQSPRPILFAFPNKEAASSFMRNRVDTIVSESDALKAIFPRSDQQNLKNASTLSRMVNDVPVEAVGMGSKISTRSRPIGICVVDEIDAVPNKDKYEAMTSLRRRIDTYSGGAGKFIITSTPSIKGDSPIYKKYEESDQRKCEVPCLKCGTYQVLAMERLLFPKGEEPHYSCIKCKHKHYEYDKPYMIKDCKWIATKPSNKVSRIAGFQISQLYSPFVTWSQIADQKIKSKDDPDLQIDFVTNTLAEPWNDELSGVMIKPKSIMPWLEDPGEDWDIPEWSRLLIAAVDVQDDRLEMEYVAYGDNWQRYHVYYDIIEGNVYEGKIWKKLSEKLLAGFRQQGKDNLVAANFALIDAGSGSHTKHVFNFCKEYQDIYSNGEMSNNWYPIKGAGPGRDLFVEKPVHREHGVKWFEVNTHEAKRLVYKSLLNGLNEGKTHFPRIKCYNEDYFNKLCSEVQKIVRDKYRRIKTQWELKAGHQHNEALDICGYIEAAAHSLSWHFIKTGQNDNKKILDQN